LSDHNYSFVVRVWSDSTEQIDTKVSIWRGSIEQVGNGHKIYFSDIKEITRIIEEQIGFTSISPSFNFHTILVKVKIALQQFIKRF
jgi:hypothetical protein